MATLDNSVITVADVIKREAPDGKIATIVELLRKRLPILDHIPAVEGNLPTGNETTQRDSLPTGQLRGPNEGISSEKSTTTQVRDTACRLEGDSVVDVINVERNGNSAAFLASEDAAFIQGLGNTMASYLFYGNTDANPKEMNGINTRLNSLSGNTGKQIVSANGSGSDNTSVVFCNWNKDVLAGIYPKGKKGGLYQEEATRKDRVNDVSGKTFYAYVTRYVWELGLMVRDPRAFARVANIDVSDLNAGTGTMAGTALLNYLIRAKNKIRAGEGRKVMYCTEDVKTALEIMAKDASSNAVKIVEAAGQFKTMFFDFEVAVSDSILLTESAVTA